ncbi:MAG: DUF1566 domain-containing protein [Comamonadaceae bacterium]|nr:DUF1566 domain-containing protein [Comamonadaceae bacterium]
MGLQRYPGSQPECGLARLGCRAFTVNGNGTVSDATTSLVWDQCIVGRTGIDCLTDTAAPRLYTWPEALAAAVAANSTSYKGFTDWRVPNKNELESIVKIDTSMPSIDMSAFPTPAATVVLGLRHTCICQFDLDWLRLVCQLWLRRGRRRHQDIPGLCSPRAKRTVFGFF